MILSLEKLSKDFKWSDDNLMKSNPDKCHLLVSSSEKIRMEIGDFDRKSSTCEKLLGVRFENRFNILYDKLVLCRKSAKNLMHKKLNQ